MRPAPPPRVLSGGLRGTRRAEIALTVCPPWRATDGASRDRTTLRPRPVRTGRPGQTQRTGQTLPCRPCLGSADFPNATFDASHVLRRLVVQADGLGVCSDPQGQINPAHTNARTHPIEKHGVTLSDRMSWARECRRSL